MKKGLGLSALAGVASGLLFLSVLAGGGMGVLLIYLTPLPLMILGLCLGFSHAVAGSAIGLATVGLLSPAAGPTYGVLAVASTLVVVRTSLLWRFAADGAVDWYPPGRVVAWLTAAGLALMLAGLGYVVGNGDDGIEAMIRHYVTGFIAELLPSAVPEVRDEVVALWTSVLPAVVTIGWLMVAMANGALGQWVANRSGRALRPTPAYGAIEVPAWLAVALLVAGAVALLASGDVAYVARNAAIALLVPHVLVGLATIHGVLGKKPNARLWLTAFYVVFVIMFGWAVVVVAGLGLMKLWTRRRRQGPGRGQEEE